MNNRTYALLFALLTGVTAVAQHQYSRNSYLYNLARFGSAYQLTTNAHTQIRPLNTWRLDSAGVSKLPDESLAYRYRGWFWRKVFNEHLLDINEQDFAITIDPLVHFQLGFNSSGGDPYWVNTRGFLLEARIGSKVTVRSFYLENQAYFPGYINAFVANRGVVPGQGIGRAFGDKGAYDFGVPGGEISYTPNKFFNFTLGQGSNFFGEGYRSMLLSDAPFTYPYFRSSTKFWKVEYVNLWAQLYDVRPEASPSPNVFAKKFLSSHLLSFNINSRLNVSFFESIVIGDTLQQRGLDVSFFNPVIFYRPVEFAVGSAQGNALLGTMASYKLFNGVQAYGQFVLDEFNFASLRASEGSWVNKFAWQVGLKHYNTGGVPGLFTRLEWNAARPYTYSHREPLTNYAHYGQPLGHPWGANFNELLLQAIYQRKRLEFEVQLNYGNIGLDSNNSNWGSDVYTSYNLREQDLNNTIGQGVEGIVLYTKVRAAYLVNPASGLKAEVGYQYRNVSTAVATSSSQTTGNFGWFFFGLRTEFLNHYYDF
jgi:hypothetical protein